MGKTSDRIDLFNEQFGMSLKARRMTQIILGLAQFRHRAGQQQTASRANAWMGEIPWHWICVGAPGNWGEWFDSWYIYIYKYSFWNHVMLRWYAAKYLAGWILNLEGTVLMAK